jgi:histidinol phosphatase-like enzyme (inositol monophosphatase family)
VWDWKIHQIQAVDMNFDTTSIIETAHALADAAAVLTLAHFRTSRLEVENKVPGGFDPVTVADKAAERAMRDVLKERRPDDGILGEEYPDVASSSGITWVLDPIDGTRGYICGTPTWGTLIAASNDEGPLFGIIDQPYIRERFVGGFSLATMTGPHRDQLLQTSKTATLADAKVFTTFPEVGSKNEAAGFHDVASRCKLTRYGMDCYAYALLALGEIDLVIEAQLNPYDIQAPIAVVEAAGGKVTNWTGGAAHLGGCVLAAANPVIHAQALRILSRYAA